MQQVYERLEALFNRENRMSEENEKRHSALNPQQLEAVLHQEGPLAVYAGAGSGKTRVIVHRIHELLARGVPPSSILAVTFTNKASREMKERLGKLSGFGARSVTVSTFHAACARFLRIYAQHLGFTPNFSIADDSDTKSALKKVIEDLRLKDSLVTVQNLRSRIDRIKNKGMSPDAYEVYLQENAGEEQRRGLMSYGDPLSGQVVLAAYRAYQKVLSDADSMDFNDLLLLMVRLLNENLMVRDQLQNRFRYFLIDEFQDTNPIQFEFVQLLSEHTGNLCIVGDDDQSIYSWRGAEPRFIMEFKSYFPMAKVVKLEQNYRSTANIIKAASQLISNNTMRAKKELWTQASAGERIRIVAKQDNQAEAIWIAEELAKLASGGESFSNFAILYRTNAQSRAIEDQLRRKMLPYIIYGSVRFYERAEIKILLTYLRLFVNFRDNLAFEKCINTPRRGFGPKALSDLYDVASAHKLSLIQAATRVAYGEIPSPFSRGLGGLKKFIDVYTRLKIRLDEGETPADLLKALMEDIGYEAWIRTTYPEDFDERWLNTVELKNALLEFQMSEECSGRTSIEQLSQFLESASLTVEPSRQNVEKGSEDAITLMTIHSAKGLEFPHVYVSGLEEGVLPHMNSMESLAEIEEERRLLYVAMTRAEQRLTLTQVLRHRFRRDMPTEPSRFLNELPESCLSWISQSAESFDTVNPQRLRTGQRKMGISWSEKQAAAPSIERLKSLMVRADDLQHEENARERFEVGDRVKHKVFGIGVVQACEKTLGAWRLHIRFPQVGTKRLLHTYVEKLDGLVSESEF